MNEPKVIERVFPVEGECEDCGDVTDDCSTLTLDTGEELTVCGECVHSYPEEDEDDEEDDA